MVYHLDLPPTWKIFNTFHASLLSPYHETIEHGPNFTEPLLRSSPKRSQSRILVSQGYRVRVSHISVNPSCRVAKWTKVLMFKESSPKVELKARSGNKPKERWFTRGISCEGLQVEDLVFGREDQA